MEGRKNMKAYDYLAETLPDGHLFIPDNLMGKLSGESRIRVMILLVSFKK
jgi:hypothetical protein